MVGSEARRNKFEMSEKVRDAQLRAVKQIKAYQVEPEVFDWLANFNPVPFKAIVKPVESAGSDDVKLCVSKEEVKDQCNHILNKLNGLGIQNDEVLVQEYLEGKEYVIDTIARDGVSKCCGIWEYHKEAVNGHAAPLVYFGQRSLVPSEEPNGDEILAAVEYILKVNEALGIKNGPAHAEVKLVLDPTGNNKGREPCLVEVGSRTHGAEGCWREVFNEGHCPGQKFDQVTATADAYLDKEAFNRIPDIPLAHISHPRVIFLVSFKSGKLKSMNQAYLEEIQNFPSFRAIEVYVKSGQEVLPTTDCFTFLGNVRLCHSSEEQVKKDYARIREMELNGLLQFE